MPSSYIHIINIRTESLKIHGERGNGATILSIIDIETPFPAVEIENSSSDRQYNILLRSATVDWIILIIVV